MNQPNQKTIDNYMSGFSAHCQAVGVDPEALFKEAVTKIPAPGSSIQKTEQAKTMPKTTEQIIKAEPKPMPIKTEKDQSGTVFHHHNNPNAAEQQIVQASAYEQGFMDKCAELGVGPEELLKAAQYQEQWKRQQSPQAMKEIYQGDVYDKETGREYDNEQLKAIRDSIDNPWSKLRSQANNWAYGFGGGGVQGLNKATQAVNPLAMADKGLGGSKMMKGFSKGVEDYTGIPAGAVTDASRWLVNPIGALSNMGHNKIQQKATDYAHSGLPMGQPKQPVVASQKLLNSAKAPDTPIKTGPKEVGPGKGGAPGGMFSYDNPASKSIQKTVTNAGNSAKNNPQTGGINR